MSTTSTVDFYDLSQHVQEWMKPPSYRLDDYGAASLCQREWSKNGYLILRKFIPDELIEAYAKVRERDGEYQSSTPYMDVPEIRDICLYWPLMRMLAHLLGEPMALHLNLTGWKSTERNWHQDDYLNPPYVCGHYAAVWTALDDIHPDSGPMELIPGSHRWPWLRRDLVLKHCRKNCETCRGTGKMGNDNVRDGRTTVACRKCSGPDWPKTTESFVVPAVEEYIDRVGPGETVQFMASAGDILIWHAGLMHRGSVPIDTTLERRSLISHYSAISKRKDMPNVNPDGYFLLGKT